MTIYELAAATGRKVVRLYNENRGDGWQQKTVAMVELKGGPEGRVKMSQQKAIQIMSQEVEATG